VRTRAAPSTAGVLDRPAASRLSHVLRVPARPQAHALLLSHGTGPACLRGPRTRARGASAAPQPSLHGNQHQVAHHVQQLAAIALIHEQCNKADKKEAG